MLGDLPVSSGGQRFTVGFDMGEELGNIVRDLLVENGEARTFLSNLDFDISQSETGDSLGSSDYSSYTSPVKAVIDVPVFSYLEDSGHLTKK